MDKAHIINKRTYHPDKEVAYLEIQFNEENLLVLGSILSLYGRHDYFFNKVLNNVSNLENENLDIKLLDKKFGVYDDNGDETGYKFGLVAVIACPEYYPHVLFKIKSKEIILFDEYYPSVAPLFLKLKEFIDILKWWKHKLDKFWNEK